LPPKQNKPAPSATGPTDAAAGTSAPKTTYHRQPAANAKPPARRPGAKKPAEGESAAPQTAGAGVPKAEAAEKPSAGRTGKKAEKRGIKKPEAKAKPVKKAAAPKPAEEAAAAVEILPAAAAADIRRTGTLYAAEVRAAAARRQAEQEHLQDQHAAGMVGISHAGRETVEAAIEPEADLPSEPEAGTEAAAEPQTKAGREAIGAPRDTGKPKATEAGQPAEEPAFGSAAVPARLGVPHSGNRFIRAMGNLLYTLGFSAEYWAVRIWRVVREAAIVLGQFLGWVFSRIGMGLLAGVRTIGREIAAPFVRFNRRMQQLRRLRVRQAAREEAGRPAPAATASFARVQLKHSMSLFMHIITILLPVIAAATLAITIFNVVDTQYALAVEINGVVVGHVTDKSVVENAKALLRDRIRLAPNQELSDWQLSPDYTLAKAGRFTTAQQLVNEILLHSTDDPTDLLHATGLYIDGELYAVTDRGEELRQYLDSMLDAYSDTTQPEAEVGFVKTVECEPNTEDLFFASAVQDYDTLVESLTKTASNELTYTTSGNATLSEIARNNNLTLDMLLARNPQYAEEADDFKPEAGESLLIRREQPFLQVQTSYRRMSTEVIPYATEEVETHERNKGVVVTVQAGEDGEQQVWDDYIYVDGELDRRVRVDELTVVLQEPVVEKIEIGTKVMSIDLGDLELPEGGYGGSYMFPVPGYSYISRGMSSGHRGLDIIASEGTPIYAAEGGTVSTAGWHYSWGNYIVIQHPNGVATLYAHCSALYVSAGQQVGQGTPIGAVGNTGNSYGAHLHLEVTVGGSLVDPYGYVGG